MPQEMSNPFGFDPEVDVAEDIPEPITSKNKLVYFTKPQIENANNWAIEIGYNRAIEPKALSQYLEACPDDMKFPVVYSMLHNHALGKKVDEHVRCGIVMKPDGNVSFLDVDLDFYNGLDSIEKPKELKD
tara:strand:+ start:384 stop:773 length:390 start_codon:yes stop_codon:yes gene_type:complete